jgi:hypothetical protein
MNEHLRYADFAETEFLQRSFISSGLYYEGDDSVIRHLWQSAPRDLFAALDPSLPYPARLERLEYNLVTVGGDESTARAGFFGLIHPDESETPVILSGLLSGDTFPRVEVFNAHSLASATGRREYIVPAGVGCGAFGSGNVILVQDGVEVHSAGPGVHEGVAVDLNRMFPSNPHAQSAEDAAAGVTYTAAKLMVEFLKDHPHMKYLFTFHEDHEFDGVLPAGYRVGTGSPYRGGFYMYDTAPDARCDPDKEKVKKLHRELAARLQDAGFAIFTGIDDPNDPDLGYMVTAGYAYAPVVRRSGEMSRARSFEHMAVALGRWGMGGVERSFCIEIPGRMMRSQKEVMIRMVMESFVRPFLE